MIKIFLPYIYTNEKFYESLLLKNKNKEFFKDFSFNLYGNFPWSYWNGSKNTNINSANIILDKDVKDILSKIEIPFAFDLSNLHLNKNDLYDKKMNMIFSHMNNGAHKIICSDFDLIEILVKKYPFYDLIFSDKACLKLPFTSDIINTLLEQDMFESIIIDPLLKSDELDYELIEKKEKVIIKIGNSCKNCKEYKQCIEQEQYLQYNFFENSVFEKCDKHISYNTIIKTIKEEILYYNKLGFTNFMIDEPIKKGNNLDRYNASLLYLFNKEENNTIEKVFFND